MGSLGVAATAQQVFSPYEEVYLRMSRAFKHLNKEHWAVHCVCTITHTPQPSNQNSTATALREAWKQLAIEYPGLMVRAIDFTKHLPAFDETNLEIWASQTFFLAPDSKNNNHNNDADTIIAETGPRDLPSLCFLPHSSEIVLLSQHWRTDALGCCMLLDRLFQILASQEDRILIASSSQEGHRPQLSPCMEVAAGSSLTDNTSIQIFARERIAAFHAKAVKSGGLPFEGDNKRLPARTKHKETTFNIEQTESMVKSCRNLQISVSAAIHTALARTYFSFSSAADDDDDEEEEKEEEEKRKQIRKEGYTTVMAVNMRPFLQKPYRSPAHACQTYVSSITPTVPYEDAFVDAARALTTQYQTWCTPQLIESLAWMYKINAEMLFGSSKSTSSSSAVAADEEDDEDEKEKKKEETTSVPSPVKPPSGVTLSSLGVVERYLGSGYGQHRRVLIDRFRFGVSMMTRQTLLYAWTFKGELTLSLNYNEAYYSDEAAQEILTRVRTFLAGGLDVQL
ncbi:MAG: hypothetical protein Q9169_007297 [Polycauliona sp. 2 TL-2023]